jgi:hypothetical protein
LKRVVAANSAAMSAGNASASPRSFLNVNKAAPWVVTIFQRNLFSPWRK